MKRKMTVAQINRAKKKFRNGVKRVEKRLGKEYSKAVGRFLNDRCPVKVGKVYELVTGAIKRRGYSRFVIYERRLQFWAGGDHVPMIHVGGWWLDKNDMPTKWDQMSVFGFTNPAVFKLSENQTNQPHPQGKQQQR